jgi:hypothetical protein
MPCPPLLYAQPPEGGEGSELPLKSLTEGFQVVLAEFGVLWIFVGVGQGYRDELSLERPECASVDASKTSEEVPAACPGEAPYPISDASTATPTSPEPVLGNRILKGECR